MVHEKNKISCQYSLSYLNFYFDPIMIDGAPFKLLPIIHKCQYGETVYIMTMGSTIIVALMHQTNANTTCLFTWSHFHHIKNVFFSTLAILLCTYVHIGQAGRIHILSDQADHEAKLTAFCILMVIQIIEFSQNYIWGKNGKYS